MKKLIYIVPVMLGLCSCNSKLPNAFPKGLEKISKNEAKKIKQEISDKHCETNLGESGTFEFLLNSEIHKSNVGTKKMFSGTIDTDVEFDKEYCHIKSSGHLELEENSSFVKFSFEEFQYCVDENSYIHAFFGTYESSELVKPVTIKEYTINSKEFIENIAEKYVAYLVVGGESENYNFFEKIMVGLVLEEKYYSDGSAGTLYVLCDEAVAIEIAKGIKVSNASVDGYLIYEQFLLKEQKLHIGESSFNTEQHFLLHPNNPFIKTNLDIDESWTLDNNMTMRETVYSNIKSILEYKK